MSQTFETLRKRVDALPEPERSARRAMYTDQEWDNLWELNAWPHQLPPYGNDWNVWTVIGPPQTGKTIAGYQWIKAKFLNPDPAAGSGFLMLLSNDNDHARVRKWLWDEIVKSQRANQIQMQAHGDKITTFFYQDGSNRKLEINSTDRVRTVYGFRYDYVWADNVEDSPELVSAVVPGAKQYVFTNPTKLHPDTVLSRAGDPRP